MTQTLNINSKARFIACTKPETPKTDYLHKINGSLYFFSFVHNNQNSLKENSKRNLWYAGGWVWVKDSIWLALSTVGMRNLCT